MRRRGQGHLTATFLCESNNAPEDEGEVYDKAKVGTAAGSQPRHYTC